MRLLVLGGTVFLGRHLVEAALAAGHQVTLFNRGQQNPGLFPGVELLRGDRSGSLGTLEGRCWDAVVDTSGYRPEQVAASAGLLAPVVEHYTFVSTISVYSRFEPADESAPLRDDDTYGGLKAACEAEVSRALGARALVVRPGLIVGPHDASDRFTYWAARMARGGRVLAPARPAFETQFIDVRDLAAWLLRLAQDRIAGLFQATGPVRALGDVLTAFEAPPGTRLEWVPQDFLEREQVGPWVEMPLWVPSSDCEHAGFQRRDCARAVAAGLAFRPLAETARDTRAWAASRPCDHVWKAGLSPEREAELLRRWDAEAP